MSSGALILYLMNIQMCLFCVPAIVAQVPDKAKDMKPQELSNVLLAAAKLKDD